MAAASPRTHRRLRHARPEGSEGAAGGVSSVRPATLTSRELVQSWELRAAMSTLPWVTPEPRHGSSLIVRWLTPRAVAIRSTVHSREVLGYPPAVIMLDDAAGH